MRSRLMSMITHVQRKLTVRPTDEAGSQGNSEDCGFCSCRDSVLFHVNAYVTGWASGCFMEKVTKPTLAHLIINPGIFKTEGDLQTMKTTILHMIEAVVGMALLFQVSDVFTKENTQTNVHNGEFISEMVIWWLRKQVPFASNLVRNIKPKYIQVPKVSSSFVTKEGNLQERDIQKLKVWAERLTDELLTLPVDALLGGVEQQKHDEIKEEIAQCHGEELLLDMPKGPSARKTMQKKRSNVKKGIGKVTCKALQQVTQHWHDITDAGWTLEDLLGPWAASARMQGFTDLDFQG